VLSLVLRIIKEIINKKDVQLKNVVKLVLEVNLVMLLGIGLDVS